MGDGYEIKIDYGKDTGSKEFFENVAGLMLGFDRLNNAVAKSFSEEIDIEAVILDIKEGSIRVWMSDKIRSIPDEKIRAYTKNPKEAIGDLLVKVKYGVIKMLGEKPAEIEREVPKLIEAEIENSPLKSFGYRLHKTQVLEAIGEISYSAGRFVCKPKIEIFGEKMTIIDSYQFDPEQVDGIERRVNKFRGKFTIKKPDLTGNSRWDLIFDKTIQVRIEDDDFIEKVRNRDVSIAHGDMLDADMRVETFVDVDDMGVVEARYYIEKVYGVVPPENKEYPSLPI